MSSSDSDEKSAAGAAGKKSVKKTAKKATKKTAVKKTAKKTIKKTVTSQAAKKTTTKKAIKKATKKAAGKKATKKSSSASLAEAEEKPSTSKVAVPENDNGIAVKSDRAGQFASTENVVPSGQASMDFVTASNEIVDHKRDGRDSGGLKKVAKKRATRKAVRKKVAKTSGIKPVVAPENDDRQNSASVNSSGVATVSDAKSELSVQPQTMESKSSAQNSPALKSVASGRKDNESQSKEGSHTELMSGESKMQGSDLSVDGDNADKAAKRGRSRRRGGRGRSSRRREASVQSGESASVSTDSQPAAVGENTDKEGHFSDGNGVGGNIDVVTPDKEPGTVPVVDSKELGEGDKSGSSNDAVKSEGRSSRRRRGGRGRRRGEKKKSAKRMLMNVAYSEEARVAITGASGLEDLYLERSGREFAHGNIFKGKVVNIEPSLQAAFVDIGAEKNGFLHVSDVVPPDGGYRDILAKKSGEKVNDRRPAIDQMLYKGQELLVQITREAIYNKGPSLTTYVSLPGRYLVLMPAVTKRGVSRKISDDDARRQLKKELDDLDPPKKYGFIIRTAGMGHTKEDLENDLKYLLRLWEAIEKRTKSVTSPAAIFQESDIVIRSIRDYFSDSIEELVIDNEDNFNRAREFMRTAMPEFENRLVFYNGSDPLFHHYGVEEQIERIFSRAVRLPSGGEILIEQTEAMVTIDVNTGSFVKNDSTKDTILTTNLEASREIARQLRLRDLGGLIMIDFIDMGNSSDKRKVEDEFRAAMKQDRARAKLLRISDLGVMEMTRQRMRKSLKGTHFKECPYCGGSGVYKSDEVLSIEAVRRLRAMLDKKAGDVRVCVNPQSALALANLRRSELSEVERQHGCRIDIFPDEAVKLGEIRFEYLV